MRITTKILIADDHTILRAGITTLLNSEPSLEVIGEAGNGKDAMHGIRTLKPDLVLIDLSMPDTNGTEAIHHIKRRHSEIKVLVLTVHNSDEYVHAALKAGADGYVLKDDTKEELINAIHNVCNGKTHLSPGICGKVVNRYLTNPGEDYIPTSLELLTNREREVIKLIAEGYRNKDIAAYLSISLKTADKHRSNLMKKLDLHGVSSITSYAIKNGLTT